MEKFIYLVKEEWVNDDGEHGGGEFPFAKEKDARDCFNERIKQAKEDYSTYLNEDGTPVDGWVIEASDDCWEMFENGFYDSNHTSISIACKRLG